MKVFLDNLKSILTTALLLTAFASAGAALVGLTHDRTADDILYNKQLTLLRKLNTIIPAEEYDNDLLKDTTMVPANYFLGTTTALKAYRARKGNTNIAVVLTAIATNGYNGPIEMLVGIYNNGKIAGVRIINHRETPGLGDAIEISRSDWIKGFDQKSLTQPGEKGWKVKRDGGEFDQFTGATITPRAVVKTVHATLEYFKKHQTQLFLKTPTDDSAQSIQTSETHLSSNNGNQ